MLIFCYIFFVFSFKARLANALQLKPQVSAVVFYSSVGSYNWLLNDRVMSFFWKEKLEAKTSDPAWPVNASVEIVNVRSNATFMIQFARNRIADTTLPPVGVFIFNTLGVLQVSSFVQFNVPCIIAADLPNKLTQNLNQGPAYNRTFFMLPPTQYNMRSLATKYAQLGVKTVVAIADNADVILNPGISYSLGRDLCIRSAREILAPNGIEVLGTFEYNIFRVTKSDYVSIIKQTRDLNPDAVLFCDVVATASIRYFDTWLLKVMRELNYLPKALNIFSATGSALASNNAPDGILQYTTQVTFSHPELNGIDFTEDIAPYSSNFVQSGTPTTNAELLLYGSNLGTQYSSARLFSDWYFANNGIYPRSEAVAVYAAFDVVEAAMYRAALVESVRADGQITGEELYPFISATNSPTPFGRVIFNNHRVNTRTFTSVEQYFEKTVTTNLVAPDELATKTFVYPMPKWDERTYTWSLFKGNTMRSIAFASVMSAALIAISVTIFLYRNEPNVRMLQHAHVISMIVAALIVLWALVFVWQADVLQIQCDAYLWTIYLPGSYVIQLANMKAYRLSVFLTSESKQRKKKLTHGLVLFLALGWVSLTAALLLVAQFIDPPTKTTIVTDQYRPSTDYNICRYHNTTNAILYFLVIEHVLMSVFCIIAVRNGSEAFKDGLIIKESFILLFGFIIVAFIFGQLGLDTHTFYFIRTLFVGLGFSLFCVRMFLSRCLIHWVPTALLVFFVNVYRTTASWFPESAAPFSKQMSKVHASLDSVNELIGDNLIEVAQVGHKDANEMSNVFHDEKRYQVLCDIAQKGFLLENVQFLKELENFPEKCSDTLQKESSLLRERIVARVASEISREYCSEGGDKEVNLSHAVRNRLNKDLEFQKSGAPLIGAKEAEVILAKDNEGLIHLFEAAQKEIRQVLFQNIWDKFKAADTESQMA